MEELTVAEIRELESVKGVLFNLKERVNMEGSTLQALDVDVGSMREEIQWLK